MAKVEDYLHWPSRMDCLQSVGEHLNSAARLSRALWVALCNPEMEDGDMRDLLALQELAGMVADQASAAEYAYEKEIQAKRANRKPVEADSVAA